MNDNEKLIAEARAIAPGVALSALDLIPDGEQQHGCIISDGAATKDGVVSAFRLLYRLADALEAAEKAHTPTDDAQPDWRAKAWNAASIGRTTPTQGEPSDAQVDAVKDGVSRFAGMQLMHRYSSFGDPWWDALYGGIARVALRAIGGVR